jgi:hypothetical protein
MSTWMPFPALITSTHKNYDPKQISKFIFFKTLEVQLVFWEFLAILVNILLQHVGLQRVHILLIPNAIF